MKAAVLYKPKTPLVVEEIEIEEPQSHEVMVRMAAAGICRSDLHFIEGLWPARLPMVMGHEGAGVVEKVGTHVTRVSEGDHVIFSWVPSCGVCRYCTEGRPYLCEAGPSSRMLDKTTRFRKGDQVIYHQTAVSAFAERTVTHETAVVKICDDMPLDKAALIGCSVMTGVGAVTNTAKVRVGGSVAVFGCGGVGLNVIQGACLAGATRIIAVDTLENKLALACEFGATDTINATKEDPVARIRELVPGGVDYAFEVIGIPEVVAQAFEAANKGGEVVMVGMPPVDATLSIHTTGLFLGKTLQGSFYGSTRFRMDMPALVELYMTHRLKLEELISRVYSLEQINEAFEALKRGEVARSIIKF
ncbi:MAG: Zn-dependent alcohol dehydrogenase [Dehalococcoidia bacterium]|jgi:S-(hydroxymethyl)glutathione dehydrogenase/alcohol dehydrogenase